jgi:hypothetical protein
MAISLLQHGGVVALGYDSVTNERGFLLKMINRTGHSSVKGELVAPYGTTDREVILQASEYDTIGIVQEAGIAEGSEMWVWQVGSVCQALLKNSVTAARGELALAADTDGRMDRTTNPGTGLPGTDTHFKEVGHVLSNAGPGTDVLCLISFHLN